MNSLLITLAAFLAGTLAVAAAVSVVADLYLRDRSRLKQRVEELRGQVKDRVRKSPLFKDLSQASVATALAEPNLWARFQEAVAQSRTGFASLHVLLVSAAAALVLPAGTVAVGGPWLLAVPLGALGAAAPVWYVLNRRRARIRQLTAQLPEMFEVMTRAVRSGQTTAAAFQAVADDCRPPIGEEMAYCYEQQNLGLPADVALRDLARRTGVMELRMFVVALLVQRQMGGNPVELFNNLSGVVRKRMLLQGKLRALTGEGRLQAVVLGVLPPLMLLVLSVVNPSYAQVLWERPSLLAGCLLAEFLGVLGIRRIIDIDY
jgi:tight adherence protein B